MFAMFIARLYDLYSIEKESLTALISKHQANIGICVLKPLSQEPEAYEDSEMEDYRYALIVQNCLSPSYKLY